MPWQRGVVKPTICLRCEKKPTCEYAPQLSSEGKTSSSSRATERIGGPIELPSGIIHRSSLEIVSANVEGRGAGRRISISVSAARAVLLGGNSGTLDDRQRHNA